MKKFAAVILYLLFTLPVFSQSAEQKNAEQVWNITPNIEYLVDYSDSLDVDEVIAPENEGSFIYSEQKVLSFGYIKSPIWLKISITSEEIRRNPILYLNEPLIQYVDVFLISENNKSMQIASTGVLRDTNSREIESRLYAWNLSKYLNNGNELTFLMRIKSENAKGLSVNIANYHKFIAEEWESNIITALTFGFLLALVLYQLALGVRLKIGEYLILAAFLLTYNISLIITTGILSSYWPITNQYLIYRIQALLLSLTCFFLSRFARYFSIDRFIYKLIFTIIEIISNIFALGSLLLSTVGTLTRGLMLFTSFLCLFLLFCNLISALHGKKENILFSVSVLFLITTFIVRNLCIYGFIEDTTFLQYIPNIALPLSFLLFSIALNNRLYLIQQEGLIYKEKSIENLEKLNRLKDDFLSTTAHELRTPLNGIIGLTSSILQSSEISLNEQNSNNLQTVLSSAWRLSYLVNDILDYSSEKVEALSIVKKPLALNQLVDMVLANLQPLYVNKPVIIENNLEEEFPLVLGDENRIQQVFFNLIGNALKFTSEGKVSISGVVKLQELVISVEDTGVGIPKERLNSIFEIYNQGEEDISRRYGGTGIGLSVTKQLVQLHGGKIWAESQPGEGVVFFFTLPLAEQDTLTIEKHVVSSENGLGLPQKQKRLQDVLTAWSSEERRALILAVDDESVNLRVIKSYLPEDTFHVHTLVSGTELLQQADNLQNVSLILLDIFMPDVSGYDLCSEIRKYYPPHKLPILMLTAGNSPHDMTYSFNMGANDYITKPVSRQELLVRVSTHIRLKNTIRQAELSCQKSLEMDYLVSFSFLTSAFVVLRNKPVSDKDENHVLREIYDNYRSIRDNYMEADDGEQWNRFESLFSKLESLESQQLSTALKSLNKSESTEQKDFDQISSEIFAFMSRLLPRADEQSEDSVLLNWKDIKKRYRVTNKEIETCKLVYEGYSNQEIADKMGISLNTVKRHIYHIFNKTGVDNRTHLIYKISRQ